MGHALEFDDEHMAHGERQRNRSPDAAQRAALRGVVRC
jgi:hypothetical protein